MHNIAPLARTAVAAIIQPTSRIPHLSLHILQRQTKAIRPRQSIRFLSQSSHRLQSTLVSNDQAFSSSKGHDHESSRAQEAVNHAADKEVRTVVGDKNIEIDERAEDVNFFNILQHGNSSLVLFALLDDSIGAPFIRYAADELFDQAILMLEPSQLIEPLTKTYRYLHHREGEESDRLRALRGIGDRLSFYRSFFERIVDVRREAGNRLSLDAYRHVLKWAAYIGNAPLANSIFENLMVQDGHQPDIHCYNYLLQAKTWNNSFTQVEKKQLRVVSKNVALRGSPNPPKALAGHQTANPVNEVLGVRKEVLDLFQRIVDDGLTADEATFISLMTAMGREGDVNGVHSILKSVWNIDVKLLEAYDEDEIESPTHYEIESPLRPSDKLLFACVHIFGSNNDARTAWLLLDYISRNYNLEIPRYVWTQLLEWYMVLALGRGPSRAKQGRNVGKIDPKVFEQVFDSMSDVPYSVKPGSVEYYLLSRVRKERKTLGLQKDVMRQLTACHDDHTRNLRRTMDDLKTHLKALQLRSDKISLWQELDFIRSRDEFIITSLEYEASLSMTQHAVCQHLLRSTAWFSNHGPRVWERRWLPELVQEFLPFVPKVLEYRTSGGTVHLSMETFPPTKVQAHERAIKTTTTYLTQRYFRDQLDTEDHTLLLNNIRTITLNAPRVETSKNIPSTDKTLQKRGTSPNRVRKVLHG